MKIRGLVKPPSWAAKFISISPVVLAAAVVAAAVPTPAARAQGIVRTAREPVAPEGAMTTNNRAANAAPLFFNAATLPVAVLDKTLALTADQKAAIARLHDALQTERQSVSVLRVAPAQPPAAVAGTEASPAPKNPPQTESTGGAATGGSGTTEPNGVPATAPAANAQSENEALLRKQAAEQSLAWNEQITVRKIRALLTVEQIARLKTTESDALLFDSLDLPVDLLGQIALTPDERANITAVFKTARRQFQRAVRQSDRDAIQNDARAQALAALTPRNKAVADAFLKAHP